MPEQKGLLFIGDPHLASRPPGFRKDDYPATILEKLRWCLNYAKENSLRPIFLGDIFDFPRDNANWLLVRLLPLLDDNTLAIYGNHDCKENTLDENDSLSILVHANKIRLLDEQHPWTGTINSRSIVIGGTPWGQDLPESFNREQSGATWSIVFWLAHHDLRFPGHDVFAKLDCREIPGIDYLINGHNHRNLGQVQAGQTLWINPGNISRIARDDASRNHVPSVLRANIAASGVEFSRISIPHAPFDEVFHAETPGQKPEDTGSVFIRALADFESVRTASGAGLRHFLDANLPQFDPKVADEINVLASEVLQDAH
jgi:predicted phosphodiesterase